MAALLKAHPLAHANAMSAQQLHAWLLQLESQRYAAEPAVSLARLRRTFPKLD
jgi:hypothetical protein